MKMVLELESYCLKSSRIITQVSNTQVGPNLRYAYGNSNKMMVVMHFVLSYFLFFHRNRNRRYHRMTLKLFI